MGKTKEHHDGETTASSETISSSQDARQSNRDLSWDREARDATLAKTITKAVARKMAKAHAQYQALLNDRSTAAIPTSLKVTSGANGFKVMDPFDWTKDRDGNCGQRRLDSPLMLWKLTQKRLRFLTSIIGSMEREWDILNHGKTAKPLFASPSMIDYKNNKKRQVFFRKYRKLLHTV